MRFVPDGLSRKVAEQVLSARKHSPTILLGAGVASMVGSTVLACRATLKLEKVLEEAKHDLHTAEQVRDLHSDRYTEEDHKQDTMVIWIRGITGVAKLYAPAAFLGGVGVVCLTKSHNILQARNAALGAAYIAVDTAFRAYRDKVVDRYGEETDRDLAYDYEQVDVIDEETGKVTTMYKVTDSDQGMYRRWFGEGNANWNAPPFEERNFMWLRTQQNWANDMLHSRGHIFLNEVYSLLGLSHTTAGAAVGWVYLRDNDRGDNFVSFGCWDDSEKQDEFFENRNGALLLDFNVDGPIWHLIDEIQENK